MNAPGNLEAALEQEERDLLARLERVRAAKAAFHGESVAPRVAKAATPRRSAPQRKPRLVTEPVSWTTESYRVLQEAGQPMHWTEILEALRKKGLPVPDRKKARDTISGVLTRQAREGKSIDHVGPGTFGLLEWQNGKKAVKATKKVGPKPPVRPESSTTVHLLDIISRFPGKSSGEIVSILEREAGETVEAAAPLRNSRVTRVGQLVKRGRALRDHDGKYYPVGKAEGQ